MSPSPIQHYVPQFLLRRFATARRTRHREVHQLWARDLAEGRTFPASVREVAGGRGFNRPVAGGSDADWLDDRLTEIERLAAPPLARLAESFDWQGQTHDERLSIALFLVTLYTRGPRLRRNLSALPGQVLEHFRALGQEVAPKLRQELEEAQAEDPVPGQGNVVLEVARTTYQEVAARPWLLLVPPVGCRFVCSDSPVLMENPIPAGLASNMGLLVEGVVLYLPLSPHIALAVTHPIHRLPDRVVRHIGAAEFRGLQWLTGFHTERWIFGRAPEDLVVPDGSWVGGRRHEIVSPPLPREP